MTKPQKPHRRRRDDLSREFTSRLRGRPELEEKLLRSQRLEALGRLTGGVAHDFNNLVAIILGNAQMILEGLSPQVQTRALTEIVQAAQRADALTRQLLNLSRNLPEGERLIDLNEQIRDLEALLQRILGADVDLETVHHSQGLVRVEPTLIQQVLLNLTVNARDAMPLGGRLSIRTEDLIVGRDADRSTQGVPAGTWVSLSVRDTGIGMTEEVTERIFDPFFSTKTQGRNTGLGLATVRGVVDRCGGHITVTTAPGKGTRFDVVLPRADEPLVEAL